MYQQGAPPGHIHPQLYASTQGVPMAYAGNVPYLALPNPNLETLVENCMHEIVVVKPK
jgi:hypothetical protein